MDENEILKRVLEYKEEGGKSFERPISGWKVVYGEALEKLGKRILIGGQETLKQPRLDAECSASDDGDDRYRFISK